MSKNEQKEPWFLDINPNGRMCVLVIFQLCFRVYLNFTFSPAIVDPNRGDFKVFETAAILLYLAQHYDKEHKFSFDPTTEPDDYSEALQWIFFSHGGIGRTLLGIRSLLKH
jgi:glutathione S-transferase